MEVYLDKELCFFEEIKMVPYLQCIHLYMRKKKSNWYKISSGIKKKPIPRMWQNSYRSSSTTFTFNIHMYTNIIMDLITVQYAYTIKHKSKIVVV